MTTLATLSASPVSELVRLAIGLVVVLGCGVFEPSEEWVEFRPPAQYRVWHGEVESCVGAHRAFEDLTWRKVYAATFSCGDVPGATGCYAYQSTI